MSTDQRRIAPGPSPISDQNSPPPYGNTSNNQQPSTTSTTGAAGSAESAWKKRVSTACLACKKSKRKCSGTPPCTNCITFSRKCIFDESLDQRRRVAAKRTADELDYHRDLLNDIFTLVREADSSAGNGLLDVIRDRGSAEDVREYINETLSSLSGRLKTGNSLGSTSENINQRHRNDSDVDVEAMSARVSTSTSSTSISDTSTTAATSTGKERENVQSAISKLEDLKEITSIHIEGGGGGGGEPSFRSKVMDLNYLCDEAPIKVPAKPWTNVTDDNDLVSHLVSLYFTWDYPVHAFLDRDVFLKYMCDPGNGEGEFCSAFLVNALLSNACVSPVVFPSYYFGLSWCLCFLSSFIWFPAYLLHLGLIKRSDLTTAHS